MTTVVTDIVDVYVFRRLNGRVQFLLLQRRNDVPMAQTWQGFHHEIATGVRASDAARQAVTDLAGLTVDRYYSADFINQFYDEARDAVVLAPVLAVTVSDQSAVDLSEDFQDAGWFDRDEATARLPFSGQRWAVRHIDEIMGIGETEAEIYRFHPEQVPEQPTEDQPGIAPSTADLESEPINHPPEDDASLEPMAESVPDDGPDTVAVSPDDDQPAPSSDDESNKLPSS